MYVIDYEIQRIFELLKNRDPNFVKNVGFDSSKDIEDKKDELKIIKLAILYLLYPSDRIFRG